MNKKLLPQLIFIVLFLMPLLLVHDKTCMAAWTPMNSGTSEYLTGIWGTSETNLFAVGHNGTILHYDGSNWNPMASGTSQRLTAVWGSSGSDVFAVGRGGVILHYDGTSWSPIVSGKSYWLFDLWGTSGSNVFIAGDYDTILHYDGSNVTTMISAANATLLSIWGSSGSDVFAVGNEYGGSGIIYHYDGSTWDEMLGGLEVIPTAVWGTSGSNVFAAGGTDYIIFHYNGTNWTTMNNGEAELLRDIWGSSGSDIFAVGPEGTIIHYNGSDWHRMVSGTSVYLYAVWGLSQSTVYAVGDNGTILRYDGVECQSDAECDDGKYCNGIETCDSGSETCLPGTPVDCPEGQICDEGTNQCMVAPPCTVTIIPSSATVFSWETFLFATTTDGACNGPCYTWEVSSMGCTGSTIVGAGTGNSTGIYTAGEPLSGNTCNDTVHVTDDCNNGIADTAVVNVIRPTSTTTTVPSTTTTVIHGVPLDCTKLLASSQFGELFRIDVTTGEAELIGYMPGGLATEIEYDVLTGILYADEVDGLQNLHSIDPETGQSLGFVTHEYASLNGLEFAGSTLYGTHIRGPAAPSDLVIVDTATGNLTHIGPTGFGPISGLAYDEGAEVMYGITAGGMPANLVTIDLSTGAATVVGLTGLDRIGSIEFGPDGNLYGGVSAFGSSFATYLVRIDTTTGAATPVGETGFSITGLTNCGAGDGCIVSCRKDESGSLNIVETAGRSGSQVTVTVEINSAPNLVDAMGFDVLYDPDCLEYTGDWQPGSCVLFWSFSFIEVTNPEPGIVRFGGFTTVDPVQQGTSCDVVELPFTVVTPALDSPAEAVRLDLRALVDDIAGWSASPGYICGGCGCDVSGDGTITPQDALCAFQKYLGICPTNCGSCEAICGDVNQDGITTPGDALCIFQEYLGIGCTYCGGGIDLIIDADGTISSGDGMPGSVEVSPGDPLASFPVTGIGDAGLDWFDNDHDGQWTFGAAGDDLHSEDPNTCPTAIRDGDHDLGFDCKVIDLDSSLFDQQGVDCDLEVNAPFTEPHLSNGGCPSSLNNIRYYDANGDQSWDDGEDIVLDVNGNNIFD